MDTEQIRATRQQRIDRKIERLRERAARKEAEAERLQAEFNERRGDHAWLTQPGHGTRFGRQRSRVLDRYDRGLAVWREAQELRARADELERDGARVKGDRERKREVERAALDQVIEVGSRVHSHVYQFGTVVRVNRKTYRVKLDSGSEITADKTLWRRAKED